MKKKYIAFMAFLLLGFSCGTDQLIDPDNEIIDLSGIPFEFRSLEVDVPSHFPRLISPENNPLSVDGVNLGRHLFFDPILSLDSTISCATCHLPKGSFTDNLAVSKGIHGQQGKRSSMNLLNLAFNTNGFFWDGRTMTLEEQAGLPVEDPTEMHESWPDVELKLQKNELYRQLFRKAFGIKNSSEISKGLATKAIAQFERTLISSGNAKYDQVINGQQVFTDLELDGHDIFFDVNPDVNRHAECGHCHNAPLFTTNLYFNNGLDSSSSLLTFPDVGKGAITNQVFDNGTFRVPTLRNIGFTAPYMHDGRFQTMDEVIEHYISGGHLSPNLAAVLRPLKLTDHDLLALKAFLKTLQEPDFLSNPAFQNPFN